MAFWAAACRHVILAFLHSIGADSAAAIAGLTALALRRTAKKPQKYEIEKTGGTAGLRSLGYLLTNDTRISRQRLILRSCPDTVRGRQMVADKRRNLVVLKRSQIAVALKRRRKLFAKSDRRVR